MHPSNSPVLHLCAAAAERERRLLSRETSWLHDELALQMAQRLQVLRTPPAHWVDWEPAWGGGGAAAALENVLPKAKRWVHDPLAPVPPQGLARWWRRSGARDTWDGRTPVDMVWANMGLRSVTQPAAVMAQWQQALVPGGLLMFSAMGPHSLQSLRNVYHRMGWGEAATPFVDMHDWGDQLVEAGFADPVLDTSFIELTYGHVESLLTDLRRMGRNTHDERFQACRTRRWRQDLVAALSDGLPRDAQGRWVIELEIVWGQAWRPVFARATGQLTQIDAGDMRAMLRRNIR